MNDAQMKALFERVMDRMVKAGWLLSYTFSEGHGFHLNWTEAGTLASVQLKKWAEALGLLDSDDRPVFCYELSKGHSLGGPFPDAMVKAQLARYVQSGFASSAELRDGNVCDLVLTDSGRAFHAGLLAAVDTLGLRPDLDHLLALFHVASGWAPGPETETRFY